MNLHIADGKVLEDATSKDPQYIEVATQSFKPSDISINVKAVIVSPEEWKEMEKESAQEIDFDENKHYRFRLIPDPNDKLSQE